MAEDKKPKAKKKPAAKKTAAKAKTSTAKKAAKPVEAVPQGPKQYAVIRTGGKQYLVSPGDKVLVDTIDNVGETVTFTDVLAAGTVGQESKVLAGKDKSLGVTVTARVVGPVKAKKVLIFKKRRRGGYTKKQGHRQEQLKVVVESISL